MKRVSKRYLGFIPVPVLIVIMAVLEIVVKPSLFYEPAWLLPITNTLFVTVLFFIVAYIAMRNYKATGRIQILLLGGGVLAFGIGGVIAGLVRSVPGAGANLNVTIYNTGALIGAVFHFAAAFILLAGISPEVGSKRKEFWLALSYVGPTVFIAFFSVASLKGLIPPFFIQGVGPTVLRQWVLGAADILFAFSFFIFMGLYLKNGEVFLYWYALALALTSISLTGFFIQSAVGSPVGWIGRFSQYLGGIYFLISIVTAMRSARIRKTSFDNVLTASLSPAEEKFRALAEHSPDIIARFDSEMNHVYVNQAGHRLYGKPAGSIIGKSIGEVGLSDPYSRLLNERIQGVFETAQPTEVEHYISVENGRRFYQSRCVPEFGVDGAVVNVLVVSHDLTERKQAENALKQRTLELQQLNDTLEHRVQERTEELQTINEELRAENEERLRVEIELRESESQLRELSTALLSAQERERKLIAGEIHDSIGASLAATKFKVETILSEVSENNPQTKVALESVIPIIQGTIEEARRIQMSLRPSILDDLGILATINWFCRQFESTYSNIRIKKEIEIEEHEVPDSLKIVIYRVLQEALNNVAKHTKASVALFSLRKTSQAIQLVIRDSGQGFDLDEAYSRKGTARGLGLDSMRERIELSGGSFTIESHKGAGTAIRAAWPIGGEIAR